MTPSLLEVGIELFVGTASAARDMRSRIRDEFLHKGGKWLSPNLTKRRTQMNFEGIYRQGVSMSNLDRRSRYVGIGCLRTRGRSIISRRTLGVELIAFLQDCVKMSGDENVHGLLVASTTRLLRDCPGTTHPNGDLVC